MGNEFYLASFGKFQLGEYYLENDNGVMERKSAIVFVLNEPPISAPINEEMSAEIWVSDPPEPQ
jgi:hypothetical protein